MNLVQLDKVLWLGGLCEDEEVFLVTYQDLLITICSYSLSRTFDIESSSNSSSVGGGVRSSYASIEDGSGVEGLTETL